MKILFVGFAVSNSDMEDIARIDKRVGVAAHRLQWGIIRGLEMLNDDLIDLLSSYPISDYPSAKKIVFPGKTWSHQPGSMDFILPHINLTILKHATRFSACLASIARWLHNHESDDGRVVVVYAMHSPHVAAAISATGVLGGKVVLIVPDLPRFMDMTIKRSLLRRFAKQIDGLILKRLVGRVDGLVVLTKQIGKELSREIPTIVVEGMVSDNDLAVQEGDSNLTCSTSERSKVLMYAGILSREYGLDILLEALRYLPAKDIELQLYGRGDMESEIRRQARKDPRIIFGGFIPNAEILKLEKKATVLVNVRRSSDAYTSYSFPSKMLEYMSSGRPVITTALPGIPEEYYEHLFVLLDETPQGLAELLSDVLSRAPEELTAFGVKARRFVEENKNWLSQSEKIYGLLKTVVAS